MLNAHGVTLLSVELLLCLACVSVFLSVSDNLRVHFTLTHSARLTSAFATEAPTHPRWLKLRHTTELHLSWLRSVVKRRHWWKRSKVFEAKYKTAEAAAAPVTTADPAAFVTGGGRRDTTVEIIHAPDSQWQNRHVEQHQHSTAGSISTAHCFQAIPNQRPHSKKLGRRQWQGIISTFHVGPALVDASVVRQRRNNAYQR